MGGLTSRPGGLASTGMHTSDCDAISLVIPANNEAESIEPLLAEIHAALDGVYDYEIVYVDDGSTDNTQEVLARVRQQPAAVLRNLRLAQNCGQSTAMRVGVAAANHPCIVTLDADGQNDPADVPRLLAMVSRRGEGVAPGLICGHRRKRRDKWLTRASSRVANRVRSRLLKDNTPDTGCGLKVIGRDLFLDLPYFDHMHRFLPALVKRAGHPVTVLEVEHRPRLRGRAHYGIRNRLWVGILDLLGVMWLLRRQKHPKVHEQ